MTTGSPSSRTTEYAISAEDPPAGETTSATGTHTVRPPFARSPARRGPVPREPILRQRMFRAGGPFRPAPREPVPEPVPEPDVADLLSDGDLFPHEDLQDGEPAGNGPADGEPDGHQPDGHGVPAREPAAHDDASRSYGDPVGDLVRAAVADRPLEEVVDLITMLEQSPCTRAPRATRSARWASTARWTTSPGWRAC